MAKRNKAQERAIAASRIARLVDLAVDALREGHDDRAHRYAALGWRVKTKYQLRPSALDASHCRACHAFLRPGRTARVRLTGGKRSTTCLRCGAVRRKVIPRPRA